MSLLIKIISNENNDPCREYATRVKAFLDGRGYVAEIAGVNCLSDRLAPADFCVVLGGDGTMLRVSHFAAILGIPLIGINLGTLGFLTDVDRENGIAALEKILNNEYIKESRLMLEAEFATEAITPMEQRLALNEVLVGETGKLIEYSIYVNEQFMTALRADGILVSTPTGSTAYNLSAGGPILVPGGNMVAITPVCPHSLSARPWVVGAADTVRIIAKRSSHVYIDGYMRGRLPAGEAVFIKVSDYTASIIKTTQTNFFSVLRKKKLL
ncbi:MAG: NAD(+)/NADH kinase [Defluviitaleaceae bacterium]|nr:NAD(+)/NADH kinase [Defluviitaleaceae bacterium]